MPTVNRRLSDLVSGSASLDTGDIDTGTFADARISAGNVTQHTTPEHNSIRQDLTSLALRQAIGDDAVAYNLENSFIDQFEGSSGTSSLTDVGVAAGDYLTTLVSYATAAYVTVNRETAAAGKQVTVTSDVAWEYPQIHLHEGDTSTQDVANSTHPATLSYTTNDESFHRVDFGAGYLSRIVGYKFFGDNTNGGQTPVGKVQGSHTETSGYVDISIGIANFLTVPAGTPSVQEVLFANTNLYRYIQFVKTAGTFTNSGWWHEIQFKEQAQNLAGNSATGTAIGKTNVPSAAQTKVSGVILWKDGGSATSTIGTDLKIYFTCIAGDSNWVEAASYTAVIPDFSTGIKMVKLGEVTGLTSGSDVRYKAVWANQSAGTKETQMHGIGLTY